MSAQAQSGPVAAPGGGVLLPPTPERLQQAFDHGIWYALSLWPALHVATANSWGGPESTDKRDWFAGAVSDLFSSRPDTDNEELEIFLLQIMQDEFDCNVEDESEVEVTRTILGLRKSLKGEAGDDRMAAFRELERRWKNRGQMKYQVDVIDNEAEEVDDEEWNGFDDDGDVDMTAAEEAVPNLVPAIKKEKVEPEVDDDGFTKVIGKKKR
ncbi:rRNA accumulation-related protein [Elasticomyces elasticus]|nr:rRNA accumulation-related protein [Elasticomyces elasticus]KAK4930804.1 rRNA accumulation-related protein [Elasticomyces elasticus]